MVRVVPQPPPRNWIRHQVERRVRPKRSSTTSRTTGSVRSVCDTALHIDDEACEPSQRRQLRRLSREVPAQWHQSRVVFSVLLLCLVVCLSWTCWLLLLTVAPNETINYVMRTKDLDNGSFWLLVEPSPTLRALSVAGLIIVAIGYLYIGCMLLAWKKETIAARVGPSIQTFPLTLQDHYQRKHFQRRSNGVSRFTSSATSINPLPLSSGNEDSDVGSLNLHRVVYNFCVELWRNHSKVGHVWMKIGDLILQLLMLYQTLEAGFPLSLVIVCTSIVVWNALAVVALIHLPSPPSQIGEAFVDSISDLLVVVVFPVLVLLYCLTTFEFDRESQRLSVDLFPRWSFQNAARAHADPEQMTTIYKSLEGLRFQSAAVCVARLGNNAALLINLRRLVNLLRGQVSCDVESNVRYPRKHPLSLLLVAIALGTIVYVAGSVHRSEQACLPFPSCRMYAYRWWLSSPDDPAANTGATKAMWNCPCRVLIDIDLAPTKFSVWKDPPHATDTVSNLAASGDLEILQVINRQLPQLPETLRRCNNLKHIALVFTHTTSLPPWAAELTNLGYLHIEGKSRTLSLASLPLNLFSMMNKLTFVHFGAHAMLPKLPDVAGLTNLRSITMAGLESLDELPAGFAKLRRLEIMLVMKIPKLKTFPDLSRAQHSLKAMIVDASPLCCNGFLQTACDLTSSTCGSLKPKSDDDPLTCLPVGLFATSATIELFHTFNSTACVIPPRPPQIGDQPMGLPPVSNDQPNSHNDSSPHSSGMLLESGPDAISEQDVQQCDGILYRECKRTTESNSSICFSEKFKPISCMDDPSTIELRRLQIERHIGPACNPIYEQWLGC